MEACFTSHYRLSIGKIAVEHKPSVFLVDDDPAVRDAVGMFLMSKGFKCVAYASAQEFLDANRPGMGGCLILDIRMPGMTGLELQKTITTNGITLPIIFITGHGDVSQAVMALKGGAVDFLEKPFNNEELLTLVKDSIERHSRERQAQIEHSSILSRYALLTSRERSVMALVADGHSNKVIAKELDISHRTVEVHRRRVMDKMGATSISDLITMAVACGIHELNLGSHQEH